MQFVHSFYIIECNSNKAVLRDGQMKELEGMQRAWALLANVPFEEENSEELAVSTCAFSCHLGECLQTDVCSLMEDK